MQLYSGFVLKTRYDTDKSELEILILVALLKRLITTLKSLKQRIKFLILVI